MGLERFAEAEAPLRRALDLLIAATALAASLPLYTCNPADFADVAGLVDVVPVTSGAVNRGGYR